MPAEAPTPLGTLWPEKDAAFATSSGETAADSFNGRNDEFRISHVQRSDGWIETTWNNMSDPGVFAVAGAEEQEGGEPPLLANAGVVVCPMA